MAGALENSVPVEPSGKGDAARPGPEGDAAAVFWLAVRSGGVAIAPGPPLATTQQRLKIAHEQDDDPGVIALQVREGLDGPARTVLFDVRSGMHVSQDSKHRLVAEDLGTAEGPSNPILRPEVAAEALVDYLSGPSTRGSALVVQRAWVPDAAGGWAELDLSG